MHICSRKNAVGLAKKLIVENWVQNWNEKDLSGRTPEEAARFYGHLELATFLKISAGNSPPANQNQASEAAEMVC